MGVLNVTPDSFSDGGRFMNVAAALTHAQQLAQQGADIIDIGAESTRPGASPVSAAEEKRRLLPVLEAVLDLGLPISVDTRKPAVAAAALKMGAHLLNDVGGLRDEQMAVLAAEHGAALVVMHTPVNDPRKMMQHARYDDVVSTVAEFLAEQVEKALALGVPEVILDPGFGFGKTTEQNLELLRRLHEIAALGRPLLVGLSRKRTIGELSGVSDPQQRVCGSVAAHLAAVKRGARILRVHDVAAHAQALAVWNAVEA